MFETYIKTLMRIQIMLTFAFFSGVAYAALRNPELVGYWQAQRDIAYDSIWIEYISDCDCAQPLE